MNPRNRASKKSRAIHNFFSALYANGADRQSTIAWDQSFVVPARTRRPVYLSTPQVRLGSANVQIFGPEIGLARNIFSNTGQAVTVVKVAFGGQPIAAWNPSNPGGLFHRLVSMVRTTVAHDARSGWLDTIGALYWFHGEADACSTSLAAEYRANLVALIDCFRSDVHYLHGRRSSSSNSPRRIVRVTLLFAPLPTGPRPTSRMYSWLTPSTLHEQATASI